MNNWAQDAVFYHLYPLGACGAPRRDDFTSPCEPRLKRLLPWIDHAQHLGATALYLGPVFESGSHGYDTAITSMWIGGSARNRFWPRLSRKLTGGECT